MQSNTDNTPCDAKQNQDDIKKQGVMDGNVLPLDPWRGNRPYRLRWKKMVGGEMQLKNQVWLLFNYTEPICTLKHVSSVQANII